MYDGSVAPGKNDAAGVCEVRGHGGTERRRLKAQELISGVGQAMTVGT